MTRTLAAAAICGLTLLTPGLAAAQWEVRPAPPSWGGTVPQAPRDRSPQAAPAPVEASTPGRRAGSGTPPRWTRDTLPAPAATAPPEPAGRAPDTSSTGGDSPPAGPTSVALTQSVQGSTGFDAAVRCTAALQIATLAAPAWSREPGVAAATNGWLARTFAEAEAAGIAGDRVTGIVEDEMQRQVSDASGDPATLSRRAFDCAASTPA